MKRAISIFAASLGLALIAAACASMAPSAPYRAEPQGGQVTIRLADKKELARFRVGVENPFIEHRSILYKPDYRFVVFAVEGGQGLAAFQVQSLQLSSAGAPVESSILYGDDLKSYWWSFSADERETTEMQGIIERLVPNRKPSLGAKPRKLWYLVAKVKEPSGPIDGWRATLSVDGEAMKLEGAL